MGNCRQPLATNRMLDLRNETYLFFGLTPVAENTHDATSLLTR